MTNKKPCADQHGALNLFWAIPNCVSWDVNSGDRYIDLTQFEIQFGGDGIDCILRNEDLACRGNILTQFAGSVYCIAEAVLIADDQDFSLVNSAGDVDIEIIGGEQVGCVERKLQTNCSVDR